MEAGSRYTTKGTEKAATKVRAQDALGPAPSVLFTVLVPDPSLRSILGRCRYHGVHLMKTTNFLHDRSQHWLQSTDNTRIHMLSFSSSLNKFFFFCLLFDATPCDLIICCSP